MKKRCEEKHVDLLVIGGDGKRHNVFIKDFNAFIYDHTLHRGRKNFSRCYLQAFEIAQKLKYQIKDCFRVNSKENIKMPKKVNRLDSKIIIEK